MRPSVFSAPRVAVAACCALLLSACGDNDPLKPPLPGPGAGTSALLASIRCTASPRAKTLSCGAGALPTDARGYIIVGGQGTYVQLTSSNVAYNSGTHVFSFDVTVQNLTSPSRWAPPTAPRRTRTGCG